MSYGLTKRGIGPAAAAELVERHSLERVQTMIELYDWHNARGEEKGPGFLVVGIRSKTPYAPPIRLHNEGSAGTTENRRSTPRPSQARGPTKARRETGCGREERRRPIPSVLVGIVGREAGGVRTGCAPVGASDQA